MSFKITTSRIHKGQHAKKGHLFLIVKFNNYYGAKQVPYGMEGMHPRIALQVFHGMQKKYNLYPPPDIIKRTWIERMVRKIKKLSNRLFRFAIPSVK